MALSCDLLGPLVTGSLSNCCSGPRCGRMGRGDAWDPCVPLPFQAASQLPQRQIRAPGQAVLGAGVGGRTPGLLVALPGVSLVA